MECTMEDHQRVTRCLSDSSTHSTASKDWSLCDSKEIFDQLPGAQAPGVPQEAWRGPGVGALAVGHWSGIHADKQSTLPLRELAKTIQEKRAVRDTRNLQPRSQGAWESWSPTQIIPTRRLGPGARWEVLSSLLLWRHALHTIESKFGVGVKAYFVFLRYLVYLNLLHCVFILVFILGPTVVYGSSSINDFISFHDEDSPLDFFLGTGFLERSAVFYRFYKPGSLSHPCLNTPLLYFTGILTILSLSLIMLVRRMAVGYKRSWFLGKRDNVNLSFKVFCGWDFTIQHLDTAALKHGFIRNDIKLYLDEQNFHLREAQRTVSQWVGLHALRVTLNLVVLALLGGAFWLIYSATQMSNGLLSDRPKFWPNMLIQYLPAITIALVNLTCPRIFRVISLLENYSLTSQDNATLMRSSFLKLASLGMFLFFLFKSTTHTQCWESEFGREMFKLVLFDFIVEICRTLLLDCPTKLLKERCSSCWLARLSRKQSFRIPFNVLDLVYNQTVLWAAVFYCPLLPFLGIVKLVAMFYFKKFKVLRCCVPEQRMFRAGRSSLLFHLMLLLGLFMATGTLGLNLSITRFSSCGHEGAGVLNVSAVCVDSLPGPAQNALGYLSSWAFAMPLIMAEIMILIFMATLVRANRKAIDRLKHLLVICSSDKRSLVLVLGEPGTINNSDLHTSANLPVDLPDPPTDRPPIPPTDTEQ